MNLVVFFVNQSVTCMHQNISKFIEKLHVRGFIRKKNAFSGLQIGKDGREVHEINEALRSTKGTELNKVFKSLCGRGVDLESEGFYKMILSSAVGIITNLKRST